MGMTLQSLKVPPRLYAQHQKPSLFDFVNLCSQPVSVDDCRLCIEVSSNYQIYDLSKHEPYRALRRVALLSPIWARRLHQETVFRNLTYRVSLLSRPLSMEGRLLPKEIHSPAAATMAEYGTLSANTYSQTQLPSYNVIPILGSLSSVTSGWSSVPHRYPGERCQTWRCRIVSHRDYHLGFQSEVAFAIYPRAVHAASQLLIPHGVVARTDMPFDSGTYATFAV